MIETVVVSIICRIVQAKETRDLLMLKWKCHIKNILIRNVACMHIPPLFSPSPGCYFLVQIRLPGILTGQSDLTNNSHSSYNA